MSSLSCRQCGQPIKFDDKRVSQRMGKKIPLDVDSQEAHICPKWDRNGQQQEPLEQQQKPKTQQKRYQCTKGCGQEIYFDANSKSQSGKFIPLDKQTGLPHQCQTNNNNDDLEEEYESTVRLEEESLME